METPAEDNGMPRESGSWDREAVRKLKGDTENLKGEREAAAAAVVRSRSCRISLMNERKRLNI